MDFLIIQHSAKGSTWKEHKYIKKIGDKYFYKESSGKAGSIGGPGGRISEYAKEMNIRSGDPYLTRAATIREHNKTLETLDKLEKNVKVGSKEWNNLRDIGRSVLNKMMKAQKEIDEIKKNRK